MKQFTIILFLVITLGLVAAAVYYLARRFALFFPAPGMRGWVWIFSGGLIFALIGAIGFSELTNGFVGGLVAGGFHSAGRFHLPAAVARGNRPAAPGIQALPCSAQLPLPGIHSFAHCLMVCGTLITFRVK